MNLLDILQQIGYGNILSIFIILLTLVEITPIKISPLSWIGKKITKSTNQSIAELKERVDEITDKLDEHIAQSFRSKILNFQSDLIEHGIGGHSAEQWKEVIDAADKYEKYVEENNISNGMCEQAIKYIKRSYQKCLDNCDFADTSN